MRYRHVLASVLTAVLLVGCGSVSAESAHVVTPAPALIPAPSSEPVRLLYGADPNQVGDLYLPTNGADSLPVVVMVHGGGWLQKYDKSYFGPISRAVAERGIAVWNIEYRRGGGDYRQTLHDVAAATDALTTTVQEAAGGRLDLDRVHVAGHSAGGQLAAWIAGRHTLPEWAPGADPLVHTRSATIMAGVFDMSRAADSGGDTLVPGFLGGTPQQVPDRYWLASPIGHVPIAVDVTAIHGDGDTTVPVDQSISYVDAARRAGDSAEVVIVPAGGHDDFVHTGSAAWQATVDTIAAHAAGLA